MSPMRTAVALGTLVVLAALLGWQHRREQLVKACLESGGVWNGSPSACEAPLRPILRRDLERS